MTKTHAVGSAMSYGVRYLLKLVFNVAVGEDDDDGNTASGRPQPAAPAGFEDWWLDFMATADNGTVALEAAWKASKAEFKAYASTMQRDGITALKKKAAKVSA